LGIEGGSSCWGKELSNRLEKKAKESHKESRGGLKISQEGLPWGDQAAWVLSMCAQVVFTYGKGRNDYKKESYYRILPQKKQKDRIRYSRLRGDLSSTIKKGLTTSTWINLKKVRLRP